MKIRAFSESTVFGVAAPASAPQDLSLIHRGIAFLEGLGISVIRMVESYEPSGYLAGSDVDRADELNELLRRDDIEVIVCARGGYGTLRILNRIDYDAARAHAKIIIGYSDITALQLALYARSGLHSISGPMVAVEWAQDEYPFDPSVWRLLNGEIPTPLLGPRGEQLRSVQAGSAEGVLIGGNLSIICKLIGTPYLPDLEGVILFLEEVSELPYKVDGLLAQLELSGILGKIAGLVFGELTPPDSIPDRPTATYREVIDRYAASVNGPVAVGLCYGHVKSKVSVPIGVRARLNVGTDARLDVLESVVATHSDS
ncbi:MAG: LD-carboxypeptidase [Rhodothermales bacterium]|nr:LD-carboxypeptidase [Rhodothermales bacterium]